jgi:hypothetical protein
MSRKIGKGHWQYRPPYVPCDDEARFDRLKRPVQRLYCYRILEEQALLHSVYWCDKNPYREAPISKRKQAHYDKLEKYYNRSHKGN